MKTTIKVGTGLGRGGESVTIGDQGYWAAWHDGKQVHWIPATAADGTEVLLRSDEIVLVAS